MLLLALDTSTTACSAALWREGAVLAEEEQRMVRGHAEALLPMVARIMTTAGEAFAAIDRLAVTVGPGHFTGLRAGIAAARGLAVTLHRPLVGVTTLEAIAAAVPESERRGRRLVVAIDSKRAEAYLQAFDERLSPYGEAVARSVSDYASMLAASPPPEPLLLAGDAGEALAAGLAVHAIASQRASCKGHASAGVVAKLAAARPTPASLPGPLYLHPAEAKPAPLRPAPAEAP